MREGGRGVLKSWTVGPHSTPTITTESQAAAAAAAAAARAGDARKSIPPSFFFSLCTHARTTILPLFFRLPPSPHFHCSNSFSPSPSAAKEEEALQLIKADNRIM